MSYLDVLRFSYRQLAKEKNETGDSLRYSAIGRRMAKIRGDALFFVAANRAAGTSALNRRTATRINLSKIEHREI